MPSFTLVLTSGYHSPLPTTVQPDSYASPTMLPTAPDHLMKTIDLRDHPNHTFVSDDDTDRQTVFKAERPATLDGGAEQISNNSIKHNLLVRKFVSWKWHSNSGPLVALKPSLN